MYSPIVRYVLGAKDTGIELRLFLKALSTLLSSAAECVGVNLKNQPMRFVKGLEAF